MARHHHTPRLAATEEAVIVLFCLVDDTPTPCSTRKGGATNPSRGSPTRRSSPSPCCSSSFGGWNNKASARSCETRRGSSRTSSPG